ncbi:MAG: hypothetical protein L6R00_20260 [Phycisphaerae bacterium]|nr:hypothetical protein [Phycisphaerae bacterium]
MATSLALVRAQGQPKSQEQEREVREAEVPKAALAALKKLAGTNPIVEFAEEIEHGVTYYEGSWKGPNGNVDVLVTTAGDVVEIEEVVPIGEVPKPVLDKARRAAGEDAKLYVEKKTVIFYEVKYRKDDRRHEVLLSPDGREHEHEEEQTKEGEDDD